MELIEIIVIILLIVLVPIVPAYILYKSFPLTAKTIVKGPFKGLNINFKGAFAGYFIVLLLVSGICSPYLFQIEKKKYEKWSIWGVIDTNGHDDLKKEDVTFLIEPPSFSVESKGGFFIPQVFIEKKERGYPQILSLTIRRKGYKNKTLILRDGEGGVEFVKKQIEITKEPIQLQKMEERDDRYSETDADVEAQPIKEQ